MNDDNKTKQPLKEEVKKDIKINKWEESRPDNRIKTILESQIPDFEFTPPPPPPPPTTNE